MSDFHDSDLSNVGENQTWVEVQKKTFTNWVNLYLRRREAGAGAGDLVHDLYQDLRSGVQLCRLLEQISGRRVKHTPHARSQAHMLDNLSNAFRFLEQEQVQLVNLGPSDIYNGVEKLILGLIWTLIVKYQISAVQGSAAAAGAGEEGEGEGEGHSGEPGAGPGASPGDRSPQAVLLDWVNGQVGADLLTAAGLGETGVRNFNRDWQSGRLLAAVVESLRPGVFEMEQLPDSPLDTARAAMAVADQLLQVPQILDPEDLVQSPDDLAVMTYVALFRTAAAGRLKKRIAESPGAAAEAEGQRSSGSAEGRAAILAEQERLNQAEAEAARAREELERMRARQAAMERAERLRREETERELAEKAAAMEAELENLKLQAQKELEDERERQYAKLQAERRQSIMFLYTTSFCVSFSFSADFI